MVILRLEVRQGKTHPSLSSRIGHLRRASFMQDVCNASHIFPIRERKEKVRMHVDLYLLYCISRLCAAAAAVVGVSQHTARLSYIVRSLFS